MPYYKGVFDQLESERQQDAIPRLASGILRLRRQFAKQVPARNLTSTLLLATWNVREFGRNAKCGPRTAESLLYIAEILSHFDLIAVQEVHQNLGDLKAVLRLLGDWWDYIVTDVTDGRSGNEERIAFVYDTRKVRFDRMAGEVAFPAKSAKPAIQAARSPFICSFRSGWRRLTVCSVHIYYGTSDPNDPRRVAEIATLSQLLAERNERRAHAPDGEPDNIVLLGDFNIFNRQGDATSKALLRSGFVVPEEIRGLPGSNVKGNKYYDQIAFLNPDGKLRGTNRAGVFDFRKSVHREEDLQDYLREFRFPKSVDRTKAARLKHLAQWSTFQLSDHLPLWVELQTDYSEGYIVTRAGFHKRTGKGRLRGRAKARVGRKQ